jgi:gliding motility-associated-like protein
MQLKRLKVLSLFFLGIILNTSAQTDTASVPYWIDMMQNEKINFHQTQRAFEIYWQNRTIEKGSGWKAFKRWEYSTSLRTDANGTITPQSTYFYAAKVWDSLAFNKKSRFKTLSAPCYSNGFWKEIGPLKYPINNTGQPTGMGRINALAFHPKDSAIIFAGAPAGGLWVSKNYGKTWICDTDSLPTLGISAIAIDPFAPDTMYIGTGDRDASDAAGVGVLWSTDGGKSWSPRNTGIGTLTVGRLIIHPTNSAILLAATNNGIYRSTNYGNSWSQRVSGFYKELIFSTNNPNIVYASRNGLFFKSSDNGISWTQITNGLPTSGVSRGVIAVTPADSNYVYFLETNGSVFQGMYLSTDRGNSFTTKSTTPNIMDYSNNGSGGGGQAWYDLDLAADPTNRDIIYSAGVNIFKSVNAGTTWTINAHWVGSGAPAVHADHHVLEYNPHNNNLFSGNDGGVYYTPNGGTIWNNISSGLGVAQIYKLGQSATNKNVLINGYQDNGSARYNGSFFTIFGGDGMDCAVDFTDETMSYGEIYYGDIFRTKNNVSQGYIAGNGRNGITESGAWVTPFILKTDNPNTMFIGYKNIWRSTNVKAATLSAVTWTKISNNLAGSNSSNFNFLESNISQPNMVYAARSDNRLFISSNVNANTPTWTDLSASLPNSSSILSIETHPSDSNIVYIAQSNKIYKSTNRGNTWTNISSNLPNVPFLSIVIDTSSTKEEIYVGGYAGVYYKDNTMSNWIQYSYGLPKTSRIQELEIYYSPNSKAESHLIAATYGRGNWRTPLYDVNKAPIALFDVLDTTICKNTAIALKNNSLNLPSLYTWQIEPSSYAFINNTNSNSENPELIFTAKDLYTITLIVENCIAKDTLTKLFKVETFDTTRRNTCTPGNTTTNWAMGITDFTLHGKTHVSAYTKDEGGYLDLTCTTIFKLKPDTFYQVNIITNPTNSEYVKGYIDFNDNGDFSDAGELVIQTSSAKTHVDTIVVPNNVVMNKPLRMRIMSDYNVISGPCSNLYYGQTQDYAVYFDLPVLLAVSSKDSICAYSSVAIKDSTASSFAQYDWDFGTSASPRFASGKGPHQIRFDSTGYQKISLKVNQQHSKQFDSLVYVKPMPRVGFSHLPNSIGLCEGLSDSIQVKDSNLYAPNYQWHKNNVANVSKTKVTILNNLQLSDSGTYYATATINGCSDTSSSFKLNVFARPRANFSVNDSDQCLRGNAFNITSLATIKKGTIIYNYTWGDASVSNSASPTHTYVSSNTFSLKQVLNTANNCKDSMTKNIVVYSQPKASFTSSNIAICKREQAFLFTETSNITSGTITRNLWRTNVSHADSGSTFKPLFATSGNYNIQLISISDAFCRDTALQIITVHPDPISSFSLNDTSQCFLNNQFDFTNNSSVSLGNIAQTIWNFGDGNTATTVGSFSKSYSKDGAFTISLVSVTNNNCKDTLIKTVVVFEQPKANYQINSIEQCLSNNNFILTDNSTITSGSIDKYLWDFGDAANALTKNTNHNYTSAGTFTVVYQIESDKGCFDTIQFSSIVNPNPKADFSFNQVCVNDTTKFSDQSTISAGSITTWKWFPDNNIIRNSQNIKFAYAVAGTKTVSLVATSSKGCKDSISKQVVVFDKPLASFSWKTLPQGGKNTLLQLKENGANAIDWQWSDSKLNQGSGNTTDFYYSDSASIWVVLKATNADGCSDTASQFIQINPTVTLFFPTIFSPNNDQLNDVLKIAGADYVKSYHLIINNRWGEIVFETNDQNKFWDGTYLGKDLQTGVYAYTIYIVDMAGNRIDQKGVIQLIR